MASILIEEDVFPKVESLLGGKISSFTRQGERAVGGRPGWFIKLSKDEQLFSYYVRGDRGGDFGFIQDYGVLREGKILRTLHEQGIPVPKIVATSEDPDLLILEFIEGEDDFTNIDNDLQRDELARDFARTMARWHSIPAERFAESGLLVPQNAEEVVLSDLEVWERGHFPYLDEPVPLVTFTCQWLRRNIPPMPERLVLVQGDTGPGQFLFRGDRVEAVLDFELAHLGDPMRELAHIRMRDVWYPTGNLLKWFEYYSEFSGLPIDIPKLRYYNVFAMLTAALALDPVVQKLNPRDEHAEWLAQVAWSKRATAEALAEAVGIPLQGIELPRAECSHVSVLYDALEDNLGREQLPHIKDSFLRHRMQMTLRLVAHLRNIAEIGDEIDEMELYDMSQLLGYRPRNVLEGQRALETLVRDSKEDMDHALINYFYRHGLREEALMKGGMGRGENAVTAPLE